MSASYMVRLHELNIRRCCKTGLVAARRLMTSPSKAEGRSSSGQTPPVKLGRLCDPSRLKPCEIRLIVTDQSSPPTSRRRAKCKASEPQAFPLGRWALEFLRRRTQIPQEINSPPFSRSTAALRPASQNRLVASAISWPLITLPSLPLARARMPAGASNWSA